MISPLSATTQKHRQALDMYTQGQSHQSNKAQNQWTMVQCKTINMIEKLDMETDVCVRPLCHSKLFAEGHSQRALFTLLPLC